MEQKIIAMEIEMNLTLTIEDIPKFTSVGSYEIDVGLNSLNDNILRWEDDRLGPGTGLQCNPDFQRGHVWTEDQQRKYVEFFLSGGNTGRTIYLNAPWWSSFDVDHNAYKDFVVVDGLQRLTALRKFMSGDLDVFGGHKHSSIDAKVFRLCNRLHINVNNLQSREEVLKWYIEMNTGGTAHTEKELARVRKMLSEEKALKASF